VAFTEQRVAHAARAEKRDRLVAMRTRAEEGAREAEAWIARREQEIGEIEARREQLAASVREARERLAARLRDEDAAREAADRARDEYEAMAAAVREGEEQARRLRTETLARRERVQATEL